MKPITKEEVELVLADVRIPSPKRTEYRLMLTPARGAKPAHTPGQVLNTLLFDATLPSWVRDEWNANLIGGRKELPDIPTDPESKPPREQTDAAKADK